MDNCPIGLGAMLTQSGKAISFASKALSSAERCSSEIEREALPVSWGYHHFRMHLLGSHFKVITGPQVPVAHLQRPTSHASARIDNWSLKLQSFHFEVLYSRDDLSPADYISRHLRGTTECDQVAVSAEHYVNFVTTQITPKSLSRDDIAMDTSRDATPQEVIHLP